MLEVFSKLNNFMILWFLHFQHNIKYRHACGYRQGKIWSCDCLLCFSDYCTYLLCSYPVSSPWLPQEKKKKKKFQKNILSELKYHLSTPLCKGREYYTTWKDGKNQEYKLLPGLTRLNIKVEYLYINTKVTLTVPTPCNSSCSKSN